MGPIPPVAAPPVVAEYASTLQPSAAHVPPVQSNYRFTRASDGKTRVDSGNLSVISNPATSQAIVLDHVKKTATIQPSPAPAMPGGGMPQMPQLSPPGIPGSPPVPGVKVEDLGKKLLQGHEVEGKRFVLPPPALPAAPGIPGAGVPKAPQMPGMPAVPQMAGAPGMPAAPKIPGMPGMPAAPSTPGMPAAPKIPGMPGMPAAPSTPGMPAAPKIPGMPAAPQMAGAPSAAAPKMPGAPTISGAPSMPGAPPPPAPPTPTTTEIWNSTSTGLPMLTKMSGGFGQVTQVCHRAIPGEPQASAFQIPQGYKVIRTGG